MLLIRQKIVIQENHYLYYEEIIFLYAKIV